MRGMNKMMVVGRLGQAPELLTSRGGLPWMRLSIATNRPVKRDEQWDEETDWHRVTVYGDKAERCMRFLDKGSIVGVEGPMTYEKWTDDEGVRRTISRIQADRVHFIANLRPTDGSGPIEAEA